MNEAIQKSSLAPATRKETTEMPSKPVFIASLAIGAMKPQIASAVNILRCACKGTLLPFI